MLLNKVFVFGKKTELKLLHTFRIPKLCSRDQLACFQPARLDNA